jgi:hypothetical protein
VHVAAEAILDQGDQLGGTVGLAARELLLEEVDDILGELVRAARSGFSGTSPRSPSRSKAACAA